MMPAPHDVNFISSGDNKYGIGHRSCHTFCLLAFCIRSVTSAVSSRIHSPLLHKMSHRAQPSGIAAEARRKLDAKYDPIAEQNARLWIEDVTGALLKNPGDEIQTIEQLNEWRMEPLGQKEFHKALKDGVLLCKLLNTLEPSLEVKVNENNTNPYKLMENISNFLKGAAKYGCDKGDTFQTVELYEGRDMGQVLNGIYAVGRMAQDNVADEHFPKLGPRQAKYSPRDFTKEQLEMGKHVCALRM